MQIFRPWIHHIVLVLLMALLYGQFLENPIIFDDLSFFMLDENGVQPVSSFHWSLLELRSLPYATLAWTKEWLGLRVINFRVGNLLLHASVVVTLFIFLFRLLDTVLVNQKHNAISPKLAAFFAALLFALHPVATYAVGYLVQRTIIMATLFSLLALLAYTHGSMSRKKGWLWAVAPLYYLAVFSKEHAIMLPAAIFALTVLLHQDWWAKIKERWAVFLVLAAIEVMALLTKKGIIGSAYEINAYWMLRGIDTQISYPLSVATQTWLFFKYVALWLLPNPEWMSVDMREPFAKAILSPYLAAFLIFLSWGGVALWLLRKRGLLGLAGFAMLFPWLMFMTELSVVRIQEEFVLYRSYLWAAGAFCLLPVVFARANVRVAIFILTMIALAMFSISMERLVTFSHPVLLWDDAEKLVHGRSDLPGEYRIYYNRGTEYIKVDQYDQAIIDLKRSIELFAYQPATYGNLGLAYIKKGEMEQAVRAYDMAIQIDIDQKHPPNPKYYLGRASAYEALENWAAASADYKVACKIANRGCDKTSLPLPETSPKGR
ncbi:MAG: tetratricopeptide repeat protein [Gallionella sp.]